MRHHRKSHGKGLTRWRHRLPARRSNGRLSRPLAAVSALTALTVGGVAAAVALSGVVIVGAGALIIGAIAVSGYWFWAKRKGLWVHVLVDTDDVVISLAIPIPLSLLDLGLTISPVSDGAADTARMILNDPELLKALHEQPIEIILDSGADHIEVVIGSRRKHWRAFQFNPVRSFSQTKSLSNPEEVNHVR
jgi:hypothetical protein